MRLTLLVFVAALGLAPSVEAQKPTVADTVRQVEAVAARGPFAPAWSSLNTKRIAFTAEDIRSTQKGAALYAIALAWPESGVLTIASMARGSQLLPAEVATVELLGGAKLRIRTRG